MAGACSKPFLLNDTVHGHIELPALCKKLIHTPHFQRLKKLKQLGCAYYVYPAAAHNRYEHCIGVAYLAGKYARILKAKMEDEATKGQSHRKRKLDEETMADIPGITDTDVLCLQIAGLCHDLGHGPYSHAWETFIKAWDPDYKHEVMSLKIFEDMLSDPDIRKEFRNAGLNESEEQFIKELMTGKTSGFKYPEKRYLYQIVANEDTNIDVDKFDYLLRDCKALNLNTSFDCGRIMMNSRVARVGGLNQIVYRRRVAGNVEDMFKARLRLHQMAYQHERSNVIVRMIMDGLSKVAHHLQIKGDGVELKRLAETHNDVKAFIGLNDSIVDIIRDQYMRMRSTNGDTKDAFEAACNIFDRVDNGDIYKILGHVAGPADEKLNKFVAECADQHKVVLIMSNCGYGIKIKDKKYHEIPVYEEAYPTKFFYERFPVPDNDVKTFIVATEPKLKSKIRQDLRDNLRKQFPKAFPKAFFTE